MADEQPKHHIVPNTLLALTAGVLVHNVALSSLHVAEDAIHHSKIGAFGQDTVTAIVLVIGLGCCGLTVWPVSYTHLPQLNPAISMLAPGSAAVTSTTATVHVRPTQAIQKSS